MKVPRCPYCHAPLVRDTVGQRKVWTCATPDCPVWLEEGQKPKRIKR